MAFQFDTYRFNTEDAIQVCVGAFALAVPIGFAEEAWQLGETLPLLNLLMLFGLSLLFLGAFTYQSVFQQNIRHRLPVFIFRIIIAYLISACVVSLVLLCLDKLPLIDDTMTSFKRIIVISMPASMGAIVVDSFDKE
ncbi:DUF2391 family protein [Shewanella xiamenensis]|uniref:DUF2391 family protein n=1 Tax=Shewanella xiamenensis TaxID=332186 RepID=UPI0004D4697B|nr:DUF2391 family protein [Shewanella xiamenensis]KEK27254.1 hypothetical protein SXM_3310 [Shewanella xiamenensis]